MLLTLLPGPTKWHELGGWLGNFHGQDRVAIKIFLAAMFWSIWKTKNRACFDDILANDPCDIIYMTCQLVDD